MTGSTLPRQAFAAVLVGWIALAGSADAQIVNGSFETGDFTGWIVEDLAVPYYPMSVKAEGTFATMFVKLEPTDGEFAMVNGFDGGGPGTILLAQDVLIPKGRPVLMFDHRAIWSMSGLDRHFRVLVEPEGGGPALATLDVRRASTTIGPQVDTGPVTAGLSLHAFRGDTVRLVFSWEIPEEFTGPAEFQLDNVRLVGRRIDPVERASLFAKLVFAQTGRDQLRLQLSVPVQPGFYPAGEAVTVIVGKVLRSFVLDHSGRASAGDAKLSVRPDNSLPGFQKLVFRVSRSDLLQDLSSTGLGDMDTPKQGITEDVPIRVDLDGLVTKRSLLVVYKASASKSGVARGNAVPGRMDTRLAIALDFDRPDRDLLKLRTFAPTQPGFLPEGRTLTLKVGHTDWAFVLDAEGRASNGAASVRVQRDRRNPALCVVTLLCKQGDLSEALAQDGLTNETTPKAGTPLQFPVRVTLDEPMCQPVFQVDYDARYERFGKAKGGI
jgi:hypothetical protein